MQEMKPLLILYARGLLGPICLQLGGIILLIQVIWEVDTQTNEPWRSNWPSNFKLRAVIYTDCSSVGYVTIGFWFVLLSLSLCSNRSKKQMKKDWPKNSHESFYYTCSLRVNFYGGLFHILQLIKLSTISSKEE